MAFTYTKHKLKKIEALFEEGGYEIRYEKGNFQSGYCLLESKMVVVINKFFEIEGRITVLLDLLGEIVLKEEELSPANLQFYNNLMQEIVKRD